MRALSAVIQIFDRPLLDLDELFHGGRMLIPSFEGASARRSWTSSHSCTLHCSSPGRVFVPSRVQGILPPVCSLLMRSGVHTQRRLKGWSFRFSSSCPSDLHFSCEIAIVCTDVRVQRGPIEQLEDLRTKPNGEEVCRGRLRCSNIAIMDRTSRPGHSQRRPQLSAP
jgi:hypothetical protein